MRTAYYFIVCPKIDIQASFNEHFTILQLFKNERTSYVFENRTYLFFGSIEYFLRQLCSFYKNKVERAVAIIYIGAKIDFTLFLIMIFSVKKLMVILKNLGQKLKPEKKKKLRLHPIMNDAREIK